MSKNKSKSKALAQSDAQLTTGQQDFFDATCRDDYVVATGSGGTGKTFTAVYAAIYLYKLGLIKKIILTRPAVEAGEKLGFLPGDMNEKIDPFMRPLYDAFKAHGMSSELKGWMAQGIVEIAPIAFMRGRSLEDALIIVDEAQNLTITQMDMMLTRVGKSSKLILAGDTTQVDLPPGEISGLIYALDVLRDVAQKKPGISIVELTAVDNHRHELIPYIAEVGAAWKANKANFASRTIPDHSGRSHVGDPSITSQQRVLTAS